jgi:leucyl/phenylalanyl-tRNA--protein transferase
MPVFRLPRQHLFPDPRLADEDGLLAVGGDLNPDRVELAYQLGIFPWPSSGHLLWFSPDPRMVLERGAERVSRSLRKVLERGAFELRIDHAFGEVVAACASVPRPGQPGTWISAGMVKCYTELHRRGVAHSFETWHDGRLVGGLYGVQVGRIFCGESMFHRETDASKFAFVSMARTLWALGFDCIDCQLPTPHLETLGAAPVVREAYLEQLAAAQTGPAPRIPRTPPTAWEQGPGEASARGPRRGRPQLRPPC